MCCTAGAPLPPFFSQVFILKEVKVVYFDTLLQVFILKVLTRETAKVFSGPLGSLCSGVIRERRKSGEGSTLRAQILTKVMILESVILCQW
jgi:hypothetical protein